MSVVVRAEKQKKLNFHLVKPRGNLEKTKHTSQTREKVSLNLRFLFRRSYFDSYWRAYFTVCSISQSASSNTGTRPYLGGRHSHSDTTAGSSLYQITIQCNAEWSESLSVHRRGYTDETAEVKTEEMCHVCHALKSLPSDPSCINQFFRETME